MNEYEIILEALQYQVDCGELTLEEAELVNECAYDRYVSESDSLPSLYANNSNLYKKGIDEELKFIDKYEVAIKDFENKKEKLMQSLKAKNVEASRKLIDECNSSLDNIEKLVDSTPLLSRNAFSDLSIVLTTALRVVELSAMVGAVVYAVSRIKSNIDINKHTNKIRDEYNASLNDFTPYADRVDEDHWKKLKKTRKDSLKEINHNKAKKDAKSIEKALISGVASGFTASAAIEKLVPSPSVEAKYRNNFKDRAKTQIRKARQTLKKCEAKLNKLQ